MRHITDAAEGDVQPDEPEEPLPDTEDAADGEGPPPVAGGREIIASTIGRSCIGCDNVSWCGRLPISDTTVVALDCAPNNDTGFLFAAERWEWNGRVLDEDACKTFTGPDLDAVIDPVEDVTILDAGPIGWSGDMGALAPALSNEYHDLTRNYTSAARLVLPETGTEYVAGADVHLEAPGGGDVSAFSADGAAVEALEVLTPSTDENGKIRNIATDAPVDAGCGGGCCLKEVMDVYFHDNYCTLDDCDAGAVCPADSACVPNFYPAVPVGHHCAKLCTGDSDCRFPEYVCLPDFSSENVCLPNAL
jgi:hypothetical protein